MGQGLFFPVEDPYVKAANTEAQASQSTSAMMKGYKSVTKKKTDPMDEALQGLAAYQLVPNKAKDYAGKGIKAVYQGAKDFLAPAAATNAELAGTGFGEALGINSAAGGVGEAALPAAVAPAAAEVASVSSPVLDAAITAAGTGEAATGAAALTVPTVGSDIAGAMAAGSATAGAAEGIAATAGAAEVGTGAMAGGGGAAGLAAIPGWGWAALGALAIGSLLFS